MMQRGTAPAFTTDGGNVESSARGEAARQSAASRVIVRSPHIDEMK